MSDDSELIYEGRILKLSILDGRWEVVEHADAVVVLAQAGQQVLGVEQYRPAIGQTSWELPAGLIEPGEPPVEAARRELAEEAEVTGEFELLSQCYSSPGFCDEKVYLFRATALRPAQGERDADEVLRVQWHDLDTVWEAIRRGEVQSSAPTVLGLSLARAWGSE